MNRNRYAKTYNFHEVDISEVMNRLPSWFNARLDSSRFSKDVKEMSNVVSQYSSEIDRCISDSYELGINNPSYFYIYEKQLEGATLVYSEEELLLALPTKYTNVKKIYDILIEPIWNINPTITYDADKEQYTVAIYHGSFATTFTIDRYLDFIETYTRSNYVSMSGETKIITEKDCYYFLTGDINQKLTISETLGSINTLHTNDFIKELDVDGDGVFSESDYKYWESHIGESLVDLELPEILDDDASGILTQTAYDLIKYRLFSVVKSGIYLYSKIDGEIIIQNSKTAVLIENELVDAPISRTHNITKAFHLDNGDYVYLENKQIMVSGDDFVGRSLNYMYSELVPYHMVYDFYVQDGMVFACVSDDEITYKLVRFPILAGTGVILLDGFTEIFSPKPLQDDSMMLVFKNYIQYLTPIYEYMYKVEGDVPKYITLSNLDTEDNIGKIYKNVQLYDTIASFIGLNRYMVETPYQFVSRVRELLLRGESDPKTNMIITYSGPIDPDTSISHDCGKVYSILDIDKSVTLTMFGSKFECYVVAGDILYDLPSGIVLKIGKIVVNNIVLYNTLRMFVKYTGYYPITITTSSSFFTYNVFLVYNKYVNVINYQITNLEVDQIIESEYFRSLYTDIVSKNQNTMGNIINGYSELDGLTYDGIFPEGIPVAWNTHEDKRTYISLTENHINDSISLSECTAHVVKVPKTSDMAVIDESDLSRSDINHIKHLLNEGSDSNIITQQGLGVVVINGISYHYIGNAIIKYGYEIEEYNEKYNYYAVDHDYVIDVDVDGISMINDKYVQHRATNLHMIVSNNTYLIDSYPYVDFIFQSKHMRSNVIYSSMGLNDVFKGRVIVDKNTGDDNVSIVLDDSLLVRFDELTITENPTMTLFDKKSATIWHDPHFAQAVYNSEVDSNGDVVAYHKGIDLNPVEFRLIDAVDSNDVYSKKVTIAKQDVINAANGKVSLLIDGNEVDVQNIITTDIQRNDFQMVQLDEISFRSLHEMPTYDTVYKHATKNLPGRKIIDIILLNAKYHLLNTTYLWHHKSVLMHELKTNKMTFLKTNNLLDPSSFAYRIFKPVGVVDSDFDYILLVVSI